MSEERNNIYSTTEQLSTQDELGKLFDRHRGSTADKLLCGERYLSRQHLSLLLARYELFKRVQGIKGSIVECGVYHGSGFMTWALLSAALEPFNYNRRILGFDTFEGNRGATPRDWLAREAREANVDQADYVADSEAELRECLQVFDANRVLNHIPKAALIRGDIIETVPAYVEENPHLLVSLLCLSVNLYEPTRVALEAFLPRMSTGAVIAIHTLNEGVFPGATLSLLDQLDIRRHRIQSFSTCPNLSYIVL